MNTKEAVTCNTWQTVISARRNVSANRSTGKEAAVEKLPEGAFTGWVLTASRPPAHSSTLTRGTGMRMYKEWPRSQQSK